MRINNKGQADTVFEVLITVILLSFVLLVGSYAMTSLSDSKCSKEIDISLINFSQVISRTASSALGSQYYSFDLPYCFGSETEVKIEKRISDQSVCNHYCPGSLGSCYLMTYNNKKDKVNPVRHVCVNISPLTNINTSVCDNTELEDDFEIIGTEGTSINLPKGRYYISSQSLSDPNICMFKYNLE